jgi:hypothetical protein
LVEVARQEQDAAAPVPVRTPIYRNDGQNVHDHAVSAVVDSNMRRIKGELRAGEEDETLAEVQRLITDSGELTSREATDALKVLGSLTNANHSRFGVSERQALAHTWNHILRREDDGMRQNLAQTLIKQLATGVEHGHVVCSTGKIARMLGTFDGTEELAASRPMWAVREEIGALAASIRDENLVSERDKKAYEEGRAPHIEERMKREFRERALKTYCEDLGMQQCVVSPMLEEFADAF